MAVSVLQGLMDIFLVALVARLVGLMAGTKLADQLPGIKIFGGDLFDQAGWLVVILIVAFWLTALHTLFGGSSTKHAERRNMG